MKISIGMRPVEGPYGGGNSFIVNLSKSLKDDGHQITYDLLDKDIDIILLINPLQYSEYSTFNNYDIDYYKTFVNPSSISIHRINECDERKNTKYVNKAIIKSNKNIDLNIFVSDWIKNLYQNLNIKKEQNYVIKGGPDKNIFNTKGKIEFQENSKIKIVTHHWSSNYSKGFDVYQYLDNLLDDKNLSKKYQFTYIGNISNEIKFKNTKIIEPLEPESLAEELKKHDIYITASKNEPSGNHHMEAALCGLPILYIDSGALPEYCKEVGIEFNINNLQNKLEEIVTDYKALYKNTKSYKYDFQYSYEKYLEIFNYSISNKNYLVSLRKKQSKFIVLNNYFFNKIKRHLIKKINKVRRLLGKIKGKIQL